MQIFSSFMDPFNTTTYATFNPAVPIYSFDNKDVRISPQWYVKANVLETNF